MVPIFEDEVTPEEYLRLDRSTIASVTVQPPRLGEEGFGGLLVKYRSPVYRYPADLWRSEADR